MKKLSIVIPAYNEAQFIDQLIERVKAVPVDRLGFEREIILVDDGSQDGTFEKAARHEGVKAIRMEKNGGKGKAVQRGISEATGDFVLVQDADLEYDPNDYLTMLECVGGAKLAVYGSRTLGARRFAGGGTFPGQWKGQGLGPWAAGVLLSLFTLLCYGKWISDTLTAYKIYPMEALRPMRVKTCGFETDHEITAKLIRSGVSIREVPIRYRPRSKGEGKKIKASDGFIAVATLIRFRFLS